MTGHIGEIVGLISMGICIILTIILYIKIMIGFTEKELEKKEEC